MHGTMNIKYIVLWECLYCFFWCS